eukprot:scaffold7779_cov62-Phaeocystis_antarctica.AAC.5
MSVMAETSQSEMGPHVAVATVGLALNAWTAAIREALVVKTQAEGGGVGGGGEGEGGDCGGGEGDGGGGEGDMHPLHWRTAWSCSSTPRTRFSMASSCAAWRFSMATNSADHGSVAAPTQSSTQKAASHLRRGVPLILGSMAFFWGERLSSLPTVVWSSSCIVWPRSRSCGVALVSGRWPARATHRL